MNPLRNIIAAVLFTALASSGASGQPPGRQGASSILVESGRASVEVTGGDRESVDAYANIDGADQQVTVRATGTSGYVVEGAYLKDPSTILRIRAPRNASVDVSRVSSGSISVTGVTGDLELRTGSGNIMTNGGRIVRASSGSGNIMASNATGEATLTTGSGNVEASNVDVCWVRSGSGNVIVDRAKGAVSIEANSGNVIARSITGSCRANALSGNVQVEDVKGDVIVRAASGRVLVNNVGGGVSAFSASDDVSVTCVSGGAEAKSASGNVTLKYIGGEVEASTASGNVLVTAPIKANTRYSLKSVSGDTVLSVQGDPAGFSASLSSFSGDARSDFPLGVSRGQQDSPGGRKLEGTHGDGSATVTLQSFSGSARIARAAAQATTCPQ